MLTSDQWINEVYSSGLSGALYLEIVSMWENSKWIEHWNSTYKQRSGKSLPDLEHATLTGGLMWSSNPYLAVTQEEHAVQFQTACSFSVNSKQANFAARITAIDQL